MDEKVLPFIQQVCLIEVLLDTNKLIEGQLGKMHMGACMLWIFSHVDVEICTDLFCECVLLL